jgi:hypothetical protein
LGGAGVTILGVGLLRRESRKEMKKGKKFVVVDEERDSSKRLKR